MKNIQEGTIIYSVLVGSRAYGTNHKGSDYDYKHVYCQSAQSVLTDGYMPQIEFSKDDVAFELKRFVELLKTSNSTILEMVFANEKDIMYIHDDFKPFIENRAAFLSKKCGNSFLGFAFSNMSKAKGTNKKMNWDKEKIKRKTIEDFCFVLLDSGKSTSLKKYIKKYGLNQDNFGLVKIPNIMDGYAVFYNPSFKGLCGPESNEVKLSSIPKEKVYTFICNLFFNKNSYSQHCKDYREYQQWLKERNTDRYVDVKNHNQQIDGKNLMHCVRLLTMAKEIALGQGLIVKRPDANYLLSIRRGDLTLEKLLEESEQSVNEIKLLYANSNLRENIDEEIIKIIFLTIRQNFIKYERENN